MEKSTNSPGAKAVDGSKNELMSPSSSSSVKKSQAENAPAAPAVKSDHAVFHCKSQSVKTLCTLLPCMRAEAKDQVIILTISAKSVLFVVEDSGKCMQANAFFDAEQHFDVFEVSFPEGAPQVIEVALNLKVLVESLMIFGAGSIRDTSLSMSYTTAEPESFQLVLEEDGVVTECTLITQLCWDRDLNYNQLFLDSAVQNQLIIKSHYLKDVFSEVADNPDVSSIEISMTSTAPFLRFSAVGSLMTCEVDFMDKAEPFVQFESLRPQTLVYALPFLRMAFRALAVATTTYIRINAEGVLCVQHTLEHPEQETESVVAFVIFPRDADALGSDGSTAMSGGASGATSVQ